MRGSIRETGDLVLDTSAVIAALRRVPGIRERLATAGGLWLPLPAPGELKYGVVHWRNRFDQTAPSRRDFVQLTSS